MAHPVSPRLRIHLANAALATGIEVKRDGTYVCMEGPQFSSYAESMTYKQLGYSVIGMTNMPEAKLAREAEMCYVSLSMVTDYDCWHEEEEAVSGVSVMEVIGQNVKMSQEVVRQMLKRIGEPHARGCICEEALKFSLITERSLIPAETRKALEPIIGKYMSENK
jgi:5'-methylthioadenosine phosphorylase